MPWSASSLATLTVTAYYPYTVTPIWESTVTSFPSGMEQRVALQSQVRYQFDFDSEYMTSSEKTSLINFFIARQGQMIPFKWYDIDSVLHYVRFNQKTIPFETHGFGRWLASISLIEVHSSEIIT